MTDTLAECNSGDLRIDPKTFRETWCARCSQPDCDLAKFARDDLMAIRNATWQGRLFNPAQADLNIPKFARISRLDFPDLLQKAMVREISERRGDWSVPEIAITDGQIVRADRNTTDQVESAVRQLRGGVKHHPEPVLDDIEPVLDDIEPAPILNPKPQVTQPTGVNTPDPGAVMIGGDPMTTERTRPSPERDPWTPPPKPKNLVIKPGASIQFGAEGGVKVVDD